MNPPSLFPCAHQIVLKLYHIFKTNQQRKTAGLKPLVEWKTYFRLWISKDATKLMAQAAFLPSGDFPKVVDKSRLQAKNQPKVGLKTSFSADFCDVSTKRCVNQGYLHQKLLVFFRLKCELIYRRERVLVHLSCGYQ